MKKLSIAILLLVFTYSSAQIITYDEISSAIKKPKGTFTEYVAKNGEVFKAGDKIKFSFPLQGNDNYLHISNSDGWSYADPANISSIGFESEIKKFRIGGSKRQGFKVVAIGKTEMGMSSYYISIEGAIENGEIETSVLTREQAIAKLKESKDLLDLEVITQEEYNKIKEELIPLIKNK